MSSVAEQIRSLEELAAIDAELKVLDEQLSQESSTLHTLKASLAKLEDRLKIDRAHVGGLDKARNDFVTEVRTMMQQLEHSRDKLNRSRNERESNAAQRELEELRKLIRDREEEVGKLTTEGDGQRLQIASTEEEAQKLKDELGAREGDINSKLRDIEERRGERQKTRDAAVKKLPVALFRKYDQIRAKRGAGIAQTSDGTCKACNMSLPPQMFHRLRREPVLDQCPSCHRIIYFVPPTAGAPAGK